MRFISWLVFVACSSHTGKPTPPTGSNTPVPAPDAAVAVAGPSEQECVALFAHAIELGVADAAKPKQAPTADETAKLEAALREELLGECRATTIERYRCAMAATSLAVLATCQATPSSSTSNNSVAPGGMTPAAPLSP